MRDSSSEETQASSSQTSTNLPENDNMVAEISMGVQKKDD